MFQRFNEKSENFYPLSADQLFGDLMPKSLELLNKIKQTKRLRKKICLFSIGDLPRAIYLLREGRVQLLSSDKSNNENFTRLIEPNEIFGLTESFANLPYESCAETITPCVCDFIERSDFIHFLMNEPKVCFRLAQLLALSFQKNYRIFSSKN